MSKKKEYPMYDEEPPSKVGKGREGKEEYANTIESFIKSGKSYARIDPQEDNYKTVVQGLKSAIKRKDKDNECKVIIREGKIFLVAKEYSDKQGWTWKTTRKKKNRGKGVIG